MERDRLRDPVALVEDAEHRDALRHRGHGLRRRSGAVGLRGAGCGRVLLLACLAARSEREREQQRCRPFAHVYSGIQGS
jgi:hypothetical protein